MSNRKVRALFKKNLIKILIPTDLLSPPQTIISTLSQLSKKMHLSINVIHVAQKHWKIPLKKCTELDTPLELGLQHWGQKLLEGHRSTSFHVSRGNVAEEIVNLANKLRTDLIMLDESNKMASYYDEIGTLTKQLIRYSKRSVWVSKTEKISKILCAVDGSNSSKNALVSAIELAKKFSCHLTILYVFPEIDYDPSGVDEHIIRKFESEFIQKYTNKMNVFLKKIDFQSLKRIKRIYHKGLPASVILELSTKYKIDLIIMGAKGHSALQDFFVGSTVEKVIPFTPCSLLVIR